VWLGLLAGYAAAGLAALAVAARRVRPGHEPRVGRRGTRQGGDGHDRVVTAGELSPSTAPSAPPPPPPPPPEQP
jgi:hypothetical protein